MNSQAVAKRFSRAAETYHQEAKLQKEIAEKVAILTKKFTDVECILDLGCGTGFLAEQLAPLHPQAKIIGIDIAEGMVREANNNYLDIPNISFLVADGQAFIKPNFFHLIASSSSLQWMLPLDLTFDVVRKSLARGGKFIFSIMVEGSLTELQKLRAELYPSKLPRTVLPKFSDVRDDLEQLEFKILSCEEKVFVRDYRSAEDFFANLYNVGVTSGDYSKTDQETANLNRTELNKLVEEYQRRFEKDGKVTATYNVGFVVAEV